MSHSPATEHGSTLREHSLAFARYLYSLQERGESGALAHIRRAHTYGTDETALRVVGAEVPSDAQGRMLDAFLLTAGLFAVYVTGAEPLPEREKLNDTNRSLGASARLVSDRSDSFDQRFASLLARPYDDLSDELRRFLRLLRSKRAPVDFAQLLQDLNNWNHEDRFVQRRWASAFGQGSNNVGTAA